MVKVQASVQAKEAIFLHSSWRAASTYVWSKFRQRPDTYCYFEPLNEHLFTLTAEIVDRFVPWSFANHPALDAPYLEEFLPLIGRDGKGGIPGFPAHLTFGRYCAGSDDSLPELEAYLADLAKLATRLGRRPVYGFVRTELRVGWFRARMPGTHIFIRRGPRRQFMSMLRQAVQGNPYFLQRGVIILRHNMKASAFAPLLSAIELPALLESSGLREAFRGRLVDETVLRRLYFIFYFMWLLARRLGEPQCHLVIDIDRLSLDHSYRREIESHLGDLVGMAISFADCRVERYDENLSWSAAQFEVLEREIETLAGADASLSPGFIRPADALNLIPRAW
ncbi:MAG TPA: hypothetical protein VJW96_08590 [Terriglobales bacterium]|jgi:hypothetical protein|nr:hypothetical protein [Terriglobales bacterium]